MEIFTGLAICIYHGLGIYISEYGAIFSAFTLIIAAILFLAKLFHGRRFDK